MQALSTSSHATQSVLWPSEGEHQFSSFTSAPLEIMLQVPNTCFIHHLLATEASRRELAFKQWKTALISDFKITY